jgi:hypothetical protein
MKNFHFASGDHGYYGDRYDPEDIWWDGVGEEPSVAEIQEARFEWICDGGYENAKREERTLAQEYEDAKGDWLYERSREEY